MTVTGPSAASKDARAEVKVSPTELIAILAMMSATVAFASDAMLPAFPAIGAELSPDAPNRAQLVIASFMIGMGVGTLFTGPLSDAIGRQKVAAGGSVLIVVFAMIAANAKSLELLLFARFLQGIGSAGPRIAAMAIVRDLFRGREMARIMSFIIFAFTLAPVFAPTIGWGLTWAFGWRAIFVSFAVFTLISTAWLMLRLPETLTLENTRPFRPAKLWSGLREVFSIRRVVLATAAQTLIFAILLSALMSSQQVFDEVFRQGAHFHLWFGLMAILAAFANLINASLVMRFGMRSMVKWALIVEGTVTFVFLIGMSTGTMPEAWVFPVGFLWYTSLFYLVGFAIGNLSSIAMEPLGHMAGLAASIISAIATVVSILIAVPVGQAFDGTLVPLTVSVLAFVGLALILVLMIDESETPD